MDGDRKYRQHGYQDSEKGPPNSRQDRPRQSNPKSPFDLTGPKLPRLVQNVVASRCFNCAVALPVDMDFKNACPKCGAALHCCKQCSNFESSTRFQCVKPVQFRIVVKDQANECTLFAPRVTVARDGVQPMASAAKPDSSLLTAPRNANDARVAFNNLFKK